jgi:hypothetical protein
LKVGAAGAFASDELLDGGALLLLFKLSFCQTDDMLGVEQPTSEIVSETTAAQAASETRIHMSL